MIKKYLGIASLYLITLLSPNIIFCQGLHGYIGSNSFSPPSNYNAGVGFYSAIWTLTPNPIAGFQIGLPSTWITPNNSDNTTGALCPIGTYARDNWPQHAPTWDNYFQTIEGGPGYWVGNRFHYGPPKFSMNSTPNCYTNQIAKICSLLKLTISYLKKSDRFKTLITVFISRKILTYSTI